MITKLTYKIKQDEKTLLYSNTASSLFHGLLMDNIDVKYVEVLHSLTINPYSQYILTDKQNIYWNINALNKKASDEITYKINQLNIDVIDIAYKNLELVIIDKDFFEISKEQFVLSNLSDNANKFITIKFLTPTAFKSQGEYVFFPDVRMIFQSLMKKYDACSDDSQIYTQEVIDDLVENIKISNYNLKSCKFHLEGASIPAFVGEVTFKIGAYGRITSLVNLLLKFGECSGVGIKTSIGMGAIQIIRKDIANERKRL